MVRRTRTRMLLFMCHTQHVSAPPIKCEQKTSQRLARLRRDNGLHNKLLYCSRTVIVCHIWADERCACARIRKPVSVLSRAALSVSRCVSAAVDSSAGHLRLTTHNTRAVNASVGRWSVNTIINNRAALLCLRDCRAVSKCYGSMFASWFS